MKFEEAPLPGVYLLQPAVFGDPRGFFLEMHYQTKHTQGKLVRVTAGEVFDAVVDVRRDSPTLGQWYGVTLSAENHHMLWVPPGFAHGFCVTSDYADFQYKCTDIYHPASEVALAWDDPHVGIEWPLAPGEAPQLSAKDQQGLAWADLPLLD